MHDLKAVSSLFDLRGDFVHGYSYGSGHINDTYRVDYDQGGARVRYIFQRINHAIFIKAGAGDFGGANILRTRSAEQ